MKRAARVAAAVSLAATATTCASAGTPPGGPEDHAPPEILSITPDSGETNVKLKNVEFKFDEVVSDRPSGAALLDQIFLISPRNGQPVVSWHRSRIDVRPKNGFKANTAYRVTMLPGLVDLRSNVLKTTTTIVFSTGATFPGLSIPGRVFDWAAQRPVNGAYIEAAWRNDTSVVYITASDSLGEFDVGPLPVGTYTVRALIDQNSNRILDRNEKWDTTTVTVADTRPHIELDAIERDSVPPALETVTALDSMTLRLTFDKYLDQKLPLQPALIRLQHADSSQIEVRSVLWLSVYERQKAIADSTHRADSLKALPPSAAPKTPARPAPPVAAPVAPPARTAPPPPKPRYLPPEKGIVVTIVPPAKFVPLETYRVTAAGMRNLVGKSREATRSFTVPKPPPPRPRPDSSKKTPADSARRPGAPPPRPPPR
ncbi:MAG: Ig-like domain-containing protein [Gemmatimonadaceae bacterium]